MHDTEAVETEGKSIAAALRAVASFHSDTSKLLVDCDKFIGRGRRSVFGNYATKDLSYNVKANFWMPEGMFRYYEAGPSLVDGVCVTFFNPAGLMDPKLATEPVFKAARIQYRSPESSTTHPSGNGEALKALCDGWDIWSLFFKFAKEPSFGQVMEFNNIDSGRIEWARLIAVPLLSITRIDDALDVARNVGSVD
jgi:hypothetical protein